MQTENKYKWSWNTEGKKPLPFASLQPRKQHGSPAAPLEPSEKIRPGCSLLRVCSNQHGLNRKYGLNSAASVSASMRRTSASLSWTNRTSLDGSSSTSTLGGNSFRPEASISLKKDGRESSLNWVMRPPHGVPHLSH